jgi:hypothetical protein
MKANQMKLNHIGSNQTLVTTASAVVLFSYSTPVAAFINGEYYRTEKNWSKTTTRHINSWIGPIKAKKMPQLFFDTLSK